MTYHAGIDVSLETSSICIVDGAGTIVRELKAPSDPDALGTALAGTGLAFARVGLKAGPPSQWLHAGLQAAGLPVVLLETRQLQAMTKTMPVKTNRSDARCRAGSSSACVHARHCGRRQPGAVAPRPPWRNGREAASTRKPASLHARLRGERRRKEGPPP